MFLCICNYIHFFCSICTLKEIQSCNEKREKSILHKLQENTKVVNFILNK